VCVCVLLAYSIFYVIFSCRLRQLSITNTHHPASSQPFPLPWSTNW